MLNIDTLKNWIILKWKRRINYTVIDKYNANNNIYLNANFSNRMDLNNLTF